MRLKLITIDLKKAFFPVRGIKEMSKWFMISLVGVFMIGANVLIASQSTTDAIKTTTIRGNEMEAAESLEQIDQITLHYQTYEKDRQGPVGFSHLKHAREYQISCWECHHEYSDGEKTPGRRGKKQRNVLSVMNQPFQGGNLMRSQGNII